jgi:hypothetical protein
VAAEPPLAAGSANRTGARPSILWISKVIPSTAAGPVGEQHHRTPHVPSSSQLAWNTPDTLGIVILLESRHDFLSKCVDEIEEFLVVMARPFL